MAITEVIPYLYYADADAALDWLERVLGFGPSTRWKMGGQTTKEADIVAGDCRISISGRAPGANEGGGALLVVHVDNIDAQFSRVALAAPGLNLAPPEKQPYGPWTFTVADPWGYKWNFWQGEADPPVDSLPE
ncbi:VOC family protein [Glaciibacter superstes]|uniref:VOC family protein n=1 Tax=Glaciibacter superstes TaxID=501023 RepID=UPI0003B5E277|nr:VOC family protein [Glaciibacter superstes]